MYKRLFTLATILLFFLPATLQAQVNTNDSLNTIRKQEVQAEVKADKPKKEKKFDPNHSPKKAALYSAVLPGLGQLYNKKFWKIPIIYAGAGTLGFFIVYNNNRFVDYRDAYRLRIDGDASTVDQYANIYTDTGLKNLRDFYRRNRDLTIILSGVLYFLNIADAFVDAHFINFDISDDLSLSVEPTIYSYNTPSFGVQLNFNFKQ